MRDRANPSFFAAVASDPHLELSEHERASYVNDENRRLVRLLLPVVRLVFTFAILVVRWVKRYLPFKIKSHRALNKLGVWFLRHMVSPAALYYVIRHFQIESALINFVADNCASDAVQKVDLFPTHVSQLGDVQGVNAIVLHDINIYNHIIDTGSAPEVKVKEQIPLERINFSALALPAIEHEPQRKRFISLDLETSTYIMVFFLVLFLDDQEAQRAALSLQLDESLMTSLANLTGDHYYRFLCPHKYTHHLRYHLDVSRDLRYHMMTTDFAYHRLCSMQDQQSALSSQ